VQSQIPHREVNTYTTKIMLGAIGVHSAQLTTQMHENRNLAYKIVQMAEGENLDKTLIEFDPRPLSLGGQNPYFRPASSFSRSGTILAFSEYLSTKYFR